MGRFSGTMAARSGRNAMLVCLMLVAGQAWALQASVATAPAFVWSSGPHLQNVHGGDAAQASYQTVPAAQLVGEVLHSVSAAEGAHKPEVVVVMMGSQLDVAALPVLGRGVLAPLQRMMAAAASAFSLPFAQLTEEDMYAKLAGELRGADVQLLELCADNGDTGAAVREALALRSADRPVVLLMCAPSEGGLSAEVASLHDAVSAVEASGAQYVALYTAARGSGAGGVRRRLAEHEQHYDDDVDQYECDDRCKAQVRALEAFILMVILLIAVSGGTMIMGAVDTPTRFEAPKKEHAGPMD